MSPCVKPKSLTIYVLLRDIHHCWLLLGRSKWDAAIMNCQPWGLRTLWWETNDRVVLNLPRSRTVDWQEAAVRDHWWGCTVLIRDCRHDKYGVAVKQSQGIPWLSQKKNWGRSGQLYFASSLCSSGYLQHRLTLNILNLWWVFHFYQKSSLYI